MNEGEEKIDCGAGVGEYREGRKCVNAIGVSAEVKSFAGEGLKQTRLVRVFS